jgi:cAMP-dependent protein kinase regulator
VVHPKSDLQRQSLQEAVKGILLFRSLDDQQLGEVLDAMFERKVVADEYIIRQGDDGDNFYVVDRYLKHLHDIFFQLFDFFENINDQIRH